MTPNASKQSAVPLKLEAARFPCLATFTPPAANTSAAVVEILKLCAPSPPVPTISKISISPLSKGNACSRMAVAHPVISSIVSICALLVDNAARKAAFCTALVCPDIISFMTVYASS